MRKGLVRRVIGKLTGKVKGHIDIQVDLDGDGEPDDVTLKSLAKAAESMLRHAKPGMTVTITLKLEE